MSQLTHLEEIPEENVAVVLIFGTSLFSNRFKFNAGAALSVMNENVRGGSIDYALLDSLGIELDLTEDEYNRITKYITISGIPSGDASAFADVSLNAFNNYLKVKAEHIRPNYVTHGQPYLSTDIQRISVYDRLRLMSNQLFFTYQGSFQKNNVANDDRRDTDSFDTQSIGVTFSPFSSLPSITASKSK